LPIPPEAVGLSQLAMTQTITLFQQMLPKIAEVRKHDPTADPEFAADVRAGEFAVSAIALGIGVTSAYMVGQPYPVYIAGIYIIGMIMLYEWMLGKRRFSPMEDT
jgi:hypothetical protein